MLRRVCLLVSLGVVLLPLNGRARVDSPLAIRAAVNEAVIEGALVRGTFRITVVNGGDGNITHLDLHLVQPTIGRIGADRVVSVGDVDQDATVVVTCPFELEKAFMDSPDPLTMDATYSDGAGAPASARVTVARDGGVQ